MSVQSWSAVEGYDELRTRKTETRYAFSIVSYFSPTCETEGYGRDDIKLWSGIHYVQVEDQVEDLRMIVGQLENHPLPRGGIHPRMGMRPEVEAVLDSDLIRQSYSAWSSLSGSQSYPLVKRVKRTNSEDLDLNPGNPILLGPNVDHLPFLVVELDR